MERMWYYLKFKNELASNYYSDGDYLSTAFNRFIQSFWEGYTNASLLASGADLEPLCELHLKLIEDVLSNIAGETSARNGKLFNAHLDVSKIIDDLESGKIAYGIVPFNQNQDYYLIGDIHSDDASVVCILEKTNFFNKIVDGTPIQLVFMGDYVDRGYAHLKTMERILLLKALFPKHICLLRGNHDGGVATESAGVILPYRIPESDDPLSYFPRYLEKLTEVNPTFRKELIPAYLNCFDHLPYIAFIKNNEKIVQCVHGGLPKPQTGYKHLLSLAELTQYKPLDNAGASICENLLWSDPLRETDDLFLKNKRFRFSQQNFDAYAKQFGIDVLYRGHEVVDEGIRVHFGGRVVTVFSSGKSHESYYSGVNPKIVKIMASGDTIFIDLYN